MTWLHLFGMLLIVATVLLTLIAVTAVALTLRQRRPRAAATIVGALAAWYALHLGIVAGVSAGEPERRLAPGEVKHFCGFYLDCHLGAAVVGRRRVDSIGDQRAKGVFEVVTLEISSTARAARLTPYGLRATLVDATGARYERDLVGSEAGLEQELGPGESYRKDLVFDVPAGATGLALDVRERGFPDDVLEWMLPGDDDSFLHKPLLLRL